MIEPMAEPAPMQVARMASSASPSDDRATLATMKTSQKAIASDTAGILRYSAAMTCRCWVALRKMYRPETRKAER